MWYTEYLKYRIFIYLIDSTNSKEFHKGYIWVSICSQFLFCSKYSNKQKYYYNIKSVVFNYLKTKIFILNASTANKVQLLTMRNMCSRFTTNSAKNFCPECENYLVNEFYSEVKNISITQPRINICIRSLCNASSHVGTNRKNEI